jgi:predicted transcriptional regulator
MIIELTSEDQARLMAMAAATQRSEADLAEEAMHWFLAPRQLEVESLARARRDIAEGRTIDHDVLFAQLDRMLSE